MFLLPGIALKDIYKKEAVPFETASFNIINSKVY